MSSQSAAAVNTTPSVVLPRAGDAPQAVDRNSPPQAPSSEGDPFSTREGSPRRILNDPETRGPEDSPINDKFGNVDTFSRMPEPRRNTTYQGGELPLPPLPPVRLVEPSIRRQRTTDTRASVGRRSNIDWIVPVEEKQPGIGHTIGERLQPTLDVAISERNKYASKAKMTGYALNAAIGLQVLLGSLTTGLSAVATTGRSLAVQTTFLGALSTIVASYLARARGSNEPELSIARTKDLEQFIRECRAFQLDHGHSTGNQFDNELTSFRRRFEELLGNANGERKLAPPV